MRPLSNTYRTSILSNALEPDQRVFRLYLWLYTLLIVCYDHRTSAPYSRMCVHGQLHHQQLGLDNLPEFLSGQLSLDPSVVSNVSYTSNLAEPGTLSGVNVLVYALYPPE